MLDLIEVFSMGAFAAAVTFQGIHMVRLRRETLQLATARHDFLSHRLMERRYLLEGVPDEDAVFKLSAVLADLDQEWYSELPKEVGTVERLSAYLANREPRPITV